MEFIESMNQLSSIVGGLGKQLGSMSRNISELDKTTKTLKNTQNTFNAALSATFKTIREAQPLTTGNRNPKQNATDDALLREAANLLRMREVTEKSYKILDSSSGSVLTEQDKKIEAILKGQEVIAGHLSDNPYLKKINDLHKSVQEDRDARRKGSIASKLEDFGAKSNNPLAQLIGGIGGTINSARSAGVTLGNAGSYWLGGGRQARKAEKNLEKNRRENTRDMPLLNAYAARQMEINKLLKSGKISSDERKRLTDELSDVRGKHGAIQERIQGRSAEMAKQTVTSLSYNERRLNPKQYRSYNSDEKKYINAHLTKNVNDSFGVGKKIGSQNSLMEALGITPGETIGSKIRASKGGPQPIGSKIQASKGGPQPIGSKIQASKGGPRPLTSGIELGGDAKKLHDLRAQYKNRQDNGAKSTDPIMRKLMGDITRLKVSSKKNTEPLRAITFGDKINATRDKRKNKSKDMWDRKFTGSMDRPSTLPEHIMSISDSMRSVKKGLLSKVGGFASNMTGGMGMGGTMFTLLAGAAIAAVAQKVVSKVIGGDGSAGGSVKDDIVMKGGRAATNALGRKALTKLGKDVGVRGGAKIVASTAKSAGGKAAVKTGAKIIGKGAAKSLVKKIPLLGAGAGLLFAGQRAMKGDFMGAGMEALSGAASLIPGIGTAVSIGLDAALVARDMSKNAEKDRQAQKAKIDKEYSEKYGFKSSVSGGKGNIELSASRLNKKYNDAQQKEIIAKLHARMYAEEMLNGRGRNIAIRDAGINAKELSTSIVG